MREVGAFGFALLTIGCTALPSPASAPPRLAEAPYVADIRARLVPPRGECLERALAQVTTPSELLAHPLPAPMRARAETLLDGLHPRAKEVLARTHGIWFAQNIPDAAAVFLPCDVNEDAGTGGFVLIDAGQFPLDTDTRDVEVPALYWRALAGDAPGSSMRAPTYSVRSLDVDAPTPSDHAVRYLIYHELGHAFSLLTGEFGLDDRGRMQVTHTNGFVGMSWRLMTTHRKYLPLSGKSPTVQAVVPRRKLSTYEWGTVLATLDADAALLAPGYALSQSRSRSARARVVCSVVDQLPQAGFVTPTAARYPTEDYAEMFAHALLADEGKIYPGDRVRVDLPGCKVRQLLAPYFSPDVLAKRQYMEHALKLDHAPLIPSRPSR
jgi:hypothetical protein